jgi:hypothetical protein
MESISYTEVPLTVKMAIIRAKVSKLMVATQVLSYKKVKQIKGGEEAL